MRTWSSVTSLLFCLTVWLLLAVPAGGATKPASDVPDQPTTSRIPAEADKRFAIAPARFDTADVDPGDRLRLAIDVRNLTDRAQSFSLDVLPLRGSDDPRSLATPDATGTSRTSQATSWVALPFPRWPSLLPSTQLRIPIEVNVPNDARPGVYALGLSAVLHVGAASIGGLESNDARVRIAGSPVSQLLIRVSGEATSELRVRDVEAPRIVWGNSTPTFKATAHNEGDSLLQVDAEVRLNSFIGTASRTLATEPQMLLPDGQRDLRLRWNDPPLLGWFQPKLVVVGGKDSGVRITKRLDTIYVLPPWWLFLLLAVAIWVPVHTARRRRRRERATGARRARAVNRVEARERKAEAKRRAAAARRRR